MKLQEESEESYERMEIEDAAEIEAILCPDSLKRESELFPRVCKSYLI